MSEKKQVKKVPNVIYSRVVGFISPLFLWNPGKAQEFKDRKTYSVAKAVKRAEEAK